MCSKNFLIFFLLFVPLIVLNAQVKGQSFQNKRGSCPPLPDIDVCEMSCFADDHCSGSLKCCRTACGGTFCTKPVTARRTENREKPGFCPGSPVGPWVCSSRCALDSDCRGSRKCCKNRCGAMACTRPES